MSPALGNLCVGPLTPSLPNLTESKFWPNFISWHFEKQIAPRVSTDRELSFEWSHYRIWSADSKVRVILQNSIKHSGCERVNVPQSKNYGLLYVQGLWINWGLCFIVLIWQTRKSNQAGRQAAPSPQLFLRPKCLSGWGLNQRFTAWQTGTYPIELTDLKQ